MSKTLKDYKKYVLIGAGIVAKRMEKQLEESGLELIGVADTFDDNTRTTKEYKGFRIANLSRFADEIQKSDVCAIVAINAFSTYDTIECYGRTLGLDYNKLFLPNPYTSLRPCVMNDDFASEVRIPVTDPVYDEIRKMFDDEESLKVFDKLRSSKTYDSANDSYELVTYADIQDMYYFSEVYWYDLSFKTSDKEYATVFDCGAYIGDSILQICNSIPEKKVVYYAFEPDSENADTIRNSRAFKDACEELEVLEYGVGNANKSLGFECLQKDGGRFVDVDDNYQGLRLEIRRMDDLGLNIKGQLYIKMDIEGSELAALKGGEEIIRKHFPFLAICVYHGKTMITRDNEL